MKVVDFQSLLRQAGVPFIDRGKNVGRGEINIRCPWCGRADPSFHLGINLDTGHWACWRRRDEHSGKSPVRLLVKVLGMPYWRARELAGLDPGYVDPDGFSSVAARLRSTGWSKDKAPEREITPLTFPRSFRDISVSVATRRHRDYLVDVRGIRAKDVDEVCYAYDLKATVGDAWAHRVILPYYMDGQLVTWTGRAIAPAEIRYKDLALESEDGEPCSLIPPKETLFNHDVLLVGGRWLVLVEGPMDAVKLDYYGAPHGVRAVALSTNSISDEQLYLLADGFQKFDHLGVMMDNSGVTSITDGMRMRQNVQFISQDAVILKTPAGAKDAAAATPDQIARFAEELP